LHDSQGKPAAVRKTEYPRIWRELEDVTDAHISSISAIRQTIDSTVELSPFRACSRARPEAAGDRGWVTVFAAREGERLLDEFWGWEARKVLSSKIVDKIARDRRLAVGVPVCCLALLSGCAGTPHYGVPGSSQLAPASLAADCKQQAAEAADASSVDVLPPDPPAKNALGAFVGNALGKSVVRRRSYGKCMKEAGYVRLH
jgi:hypothetical protein